MDKNYLVLGVDLGTNGVRIAVINEYNLLVHFASTQYLTGLDNCEDWRIACKALIKKIPDEFKKRLIACSVDGTSGTLMACKANGDAIPILN